MNKQAREGVKSVCQGAVLAVIGGVVMLVGHAWSFVAMVGVLCLGGGGILLLLGLLNIGQGVSAGD